MSLLFTDIEGSTRLLHEIGDVYGEVLSEHDRLLRGVWEAHGGVVVGTEGDAFFVAFSDPAEAVAAALEAQSALARYRWPHGGAVRVRMGLHTGSPRVRDGDYWGVDVHYAARLCSAAHGGQVLLGASTRELVPTAPVDDLGEHALKDFPVPRRLFHLRAMGRSAADFPPPRTAAGARSNLPSLPDRLIGREQAITGVRTALCGGARLLTLTGVGGSGKTRLALACGADLLGNFADGVFLVRLASVFDEDAVALAIAAAIGVQPHGGIDAEAALVAYLTGRNELLIIDNMEHLIGAAPLLSRLLEAVPDLRMLVTSQAPLRLRSEVVMPVAPLNVPSTHAAGIAELQSVPSVALFVERARAIDPAFVLTCANAPIVAELCRRLDGLPLAIELAAARVRVAGPERLLAAVERSIDALGSGPRDLPERQRGLRAALDYTASLLDEATRDLFAALGVFAGAWTIEQLECMFGSETDIWDAVATLLDFALIRTRGDGRMTMAEPVRAYAQALLAEHGQEHDARHRHAMMLAEEADAISDGLLLSTRSLAARTLDLADEFDAAIHWSSTHDPALHRRLIAALGTPYYLVNRLSAIADEIPAWVRRDDARDAVSARLSLAHAVVLTSCGEIEAAVAAAADAARCRRQLGDEAGEAVAVAIQAQILSQTGTQDDHVAERLTAVLTLPTVQHEPHLRALVRGELAQNHEVMGRIAEAEELVSEICSDQRLTDTFIGMAALNCWGDCAMAQGQFAAALGRYAAVARQVRGSMPLNELAVSLGIAEALAGLERDAEAIELRSAAEAAARGALRATALVETPSPRADALLAASRTRLGEPAAARAREAGCATRHGQLLDLALQLAERALDDPRRLPHASSSRPAS